MAPIPEDNRDKAPNKDSDEINNFSNPNLVSTLEIADSSDDSDGEEDESAAPSGYSLLPQDPSEIGNMDSDDESDHGEADSDFTSAIGRPDGEEVVPEAVLTSEAGAAAPTVSLANVVEQNHPAFLAKFPDGKLPSYMQVPSVPRDGTDQLWNSKRQEESKIVFDSTQESRILKAMAGFSLPPSNIPEWAHTLSDEKWRQHIQDRIHTNQENAAPTKHSSSTSLPEERCPGQDSKDSDPEGEGWVADFSESVNIDG